jgi:hypothetical protein
VALERLQALALFWVPQNDLVVNRTIIIIIIIITPSAREKLAVKTPGDRHDPFAAIQMSGNTYVTVVYASPSLNLRLSPGRAKHERKMLSPVALQAQKFRSCLCADEMDAPI